MPAHPSTYSIRGRTALGAILAAAAGVLWVMLWVYGDLGSGAALGTSVVYVLLLGTAGYFYWFTVEFLRSAAAKIIVACAIQTVCLGLCFAVTIITGMLSTQQAVHILPLCTVYGLLIWLALTLYYTRLLAVDRAAEDMPEPVTAASESMPETNPERQLIDRITVKNGPEIEIIPIENLLYIQAYGDYVMLFTEKGRFVKEQTMKFYENALPDHFVRVHRSFIVNTNTITRVELSGKENYTVKLRNGMGIRASSPGYKLLRQRMSL